MNLGLGTSTNPLPQDWMQSVLATVTTTKHTIQHSVMETVQCPTV